MIDFLKNRQNTIIDIPKQQINEWITTLFELLGGEVWLNKSSNVDHPIVKLWNRRDFMSTNELVNFARAVSIMLNVDENWTKGKMTGEQNIVPFESVNFSTV